MNQCYRPDLIIWLRIQKVHKPRNQNFNKSEYSRGVFYHRGNSWPLHRYITVSRDEFSKHLKVYFSSSNEEFMRTSTVVYTKLLAFIAICWSEGHNPTFFVYHLQIYDHFYNIIAIEKPNISAIVKLRTVCV